MSIAYDTEEMVEDHRMELENRIRNLVWTVSGDYKIPVKPDVSLFLKSKELALYEGIKQGSFARFYDQDEVGMYLIRKIYLGGKEQELTILSQLCIEEASGHRIRKERPGITAIRKTAMEYLLDEEGEKRKSREHLIETIYEAMLSYWISEAEGSVRKREQRIENFMDMIREARAADTTMELIACIDRCYNTMIDQGFEKKYGSLEKVLAVTLEELIEDGWDDYLQDELYEEQLQEALERLKEQAVSIAGNPENVMEAKDSSGAKAVITVTPEMQKKAEHFVELNFGKSYLSVLETGRIQRQFCRDIHKESRLHFTEGILKNPVMRNYQYEYALRLKKKNELFYKENYTAAKKNIAELTALLKKALAVKHEAQNQLSDRGNIIPSRLWRVGRTQNVHLFQKEIKGDQSGTVVEILMDASGSQMNRQSEVALQAFMISRALSEAGLPHQVMSYCTFWDYTVLHRLRDFDESGDADFGIFHYVTSSNNRDGLSLRAAGSSLLEREEEQKILIVLSDGRPNDAIVKRPGGLLSEQGNTAIPYTGEAAVKDTAAEVRRLRSHGIHVLGVFHGEEKDLQAEQKIFGKDFAYIKDIRGFSKIVGRYLLKQLDLS